VDLLADIRKGMKLKKVDTPSDSPKLGAAGPSGKKAGGAGGSTSPTDLADKLRLVMEARRGKVANEETDDDEW
jgi:hypothetical protein